MQEKLFGRIIRRRTPVNVADELQNIERESKIPNHRIFFVDDTFLFFRDWIVSFCNEIKRRELKFQWSCQARVDDINMELLKIIKETGCFSISLGIESGSQKILDFLRKGTKVNDAIRAFDLCHMVGLGSHAYVIVGSPMETKKDLNDTVKLIKRIRPSSIGVSRLTPTKGSDLYEFSVANGLLTIDNPEEYDYYSNAHPLRLSYISRKELDYYINIMHDIITIENFKKHIRDLISNPLYLVKLVFAMFQNPKFAITRIKQGIKLLIKYLRVKNS